MNIADNIIKAALKNVYFVCGNACGGKTTLSRALAGKHGLLLYDMDACYAEHRAMADEAHQPEMCYHMKDHHAQWTRPVSEQARWSMESLNEQAEMALVDLVRLSQHGKVVADVLYSSIYTPQLLDPRQIVFLTVDISLIRKCYFNRPEKRGFYDFVAKQPLADIYFENIFRSLELTNRLEQQSMRESGFLMLERTENSTVESTLAMVEAHFGLGN